jgi:hypothetical protein
MALQIHGLVPREAPRRGGRVHVVLGNHEVMVGSFHALAPEPVPQANY